MDFGELTSSGQPKNVYNHPRSVAELIYRILGVYIGFVSFQHNFQGLVDLLNHLKLLRSMEDEDIRKGYGMLVNEHTKIPIKTKLDRDLINKLEQVWERGGYLLTRYVQVDEGFIDIKEESYLFEYPDWELGDMEDIQRMPALFSMKSKDEVSSDRFFMRINESVLEREAYRYHDPEWLCENGKLEKEKNGVLIPYFKTYDDIMKSTRTTQEVPRLYYDTMTTISWRKSLEYLNPLHVNVWAIAQELERIDYLSQSRQNIAKRIKMKPAGA